MDQVGHADSTMTMDVYAQLEKRYKRSARQGYLAVSGAAWD